VSLERKLEGLESELKLVKGEIKQTLVDLREYLAQREAPFSNLKVARLSAEAQVAAPVPLRKEEREAAPEPESRPEPAAQRQQQRGHYAQEAGQRHEHAGPQPPDAQYPPHLAAVGGPSPAQPGPVTPAGAWGPPPADYYQGQVSGYNGPAAPEPAPTSAPWRGAILTLTGNRRQPQAPVNQAQPPEFTPPPPASAPAPEAAAPPPAAAAPAAAPAADQPDVQQVAGIIKWLAWAKDLLGPEGPGRLLDLYNLTFRIAPATLEMIRAAETLVPDPAQPPATSSAEDAIALLLELHGILSGGGALMLLLHAMPQRGV